MQPPVLSRFLVEDYVDAPSWFGRFIQTLNRFMEQTTLILDKNIAFGDNIVSRRFAATIVTDPAYATGTFIPIPFSWPSRSLPLFVLVQVRHDDGTPFLGSTGTPAWTFNNGNINVSYIPGLAPSTKYLVSFLAF